jgi:lysophospholipase
MKNTPDLPEKFLLPREWQKSGFVNPITNHHIHYNYALARDKVEDTKATILILPGLSEFSEKYIELTRDFLAKDFNVYIIDWAYQGRSSRFIPNAHKRYSDGYETDISDLHQLVQEIIPHNKPIIMLGHSMGAHIGLRYLQDHPNIISAAGLSAPMMCIKSLTSIKCPLKWLLKNVPSVHSCYIPGGKDWHKEMRLGDEKDIFSSDKVRNKIHNAWSLAATELQIGNVTIKWVYETLKSCSILNKKSKNQKINTPVFIATSGQETLVDNKATQRFLDTLPHAELIEIPMAKHEILMETNEIRDVFLNKFYELIDKAIKT